MKSNNPYRAIRQAILHGDPGEVDEALNRLETSGTPDLFARLLERTIIDKEGILWVNPGFVTTCFRQQTIDYAFWQIIAMAPKAVARKVWRKKPGHRVVSFRAYGRHLVKPELLTRFPSLLYRLGEINEINASTTAFSSLPESIGEIIGLKRLRICGGSFTTVPCSFGKLLSLETLNLSGNNLESLPDSFSGLQNLSYLNLSRNRLSHIPAVVGDLTGLQELHLKKNRIVEICPEIFRCNGLRQLDLSENLLKEIPTGIQGLRNLVGIDLTENRELKTVHEDFSWLSGLEKIKLIHCMDLRPTPFRKDLQNRQMVVRYQRQLRKLAGLSFEGLELETKKFAGKQVLQKGKRLSGSSAMKPFRVNTIQGPSVPEEKLAAVDLICAMLESTSNENFIAGVRLLEASGDAELSEACLFRSFPLENGAWECGWLKESRKERPSILLSHLAGPLCLSRSESHAWLNQITRLSIVMFSPDLMSNLAILPALRELSVTFQVPVPGLVFNGIRKIQKLSLKNLHTGVFMADQHDLQCCTHLEINESSFTSPFVLRNLTQLRKLSLRFCDAPSLTIFNCPALESISLFLPKNKVAADEALTVSISKCKALDCLEIYGGRMDAIDISGAPDLKSMHLYDCNIGHLSISPKDASALTSLTMMRCELESLPEFFRQLVGLEILDLSDNMLRELPDNWSSPRLKYLSISGNQFKKIPAVIWTMSKLRHLDVGCQTCNSPGQNSLRTLDPALPPLRGLRRFIIRWPDLLIRKYSYLFPNARISS